MVTCPRGEWKTTCRAPVKLLSRQIYTARACKQLAPSSRWTTALTVHQITDLGALDAPHSDVKYKPKRHNSKHCVRVCVCVCVQTLQGSSVSRWVCVGVTQGNERARHS